MSGTADGASRIRPACRLAVLVVVAIAMATAGCGSGVRGSSPPTEPTNPTPHQVLSEGAPIGSPPIREDITEAQRRIANTIDSGDCERINALYTLASVETEIDDSCETLKTLGRSRVSGLASYGAQAGVVGYTTRDGPASMILVRDSDGLFHIALVASHQTPTTVGTPFAKPFDAVAGAAVEALRRRDCDGFLTVANRESGIGALPRWQACLAVEVDPVQSGLFDTPDARPRRLGGNGFFAFYGLDTDNAYFTIVLAKRDLASGSDQSSGAAPHQYSYLASYLTNTRGAAPAESRPDQSSSATRGASRLK